ncbi:FAD-dependent oxidoreductase [Salinibacterium sp.]|uniref:protoporphyrinogen/coproporphyrinogen oxidase n=1 Tax=Salinibacterium sp. TaxID=1915057 RepID=UPI00286B7FA7|nr:FAD-dependent oxidoreductase [Salinibacterium sp.]
MVAEPGSADVTVVGGGIAGMVVARRLAMAGRAVTLIEASDHLGGTVARHTVGGIDLDAGAESFATRGGTVADLAAELGLGDDIVTPTAGGAWLQPAVGPAVPLPATNVLGIPGTPLAADVIAVIGQRAALRAELDAIIPSLWARKSLTLGALVRRRMGSGVLEKLVAPVVHGVHSMHPDEMQLDRAAPGLRAALAREGSLAAAVRFMRDAAPAGSAVAGIRGGIHRLATELGADLETYGVQVQLGHRVSPADLKGVVIMAAPVDPSAGRRIVLATLVVDSPELDAAPRGTGLLVADGATATSARALTHATAKWDWLRERAGGRHVLRLSYDVEPEALHTTARLDACALLGVQLDDSSVIDFARVEWLRPAASGPHPVGDGIVIVGETVAGSGLAGVIRQAEVVAHELLEA